MQNSGKTRLDAGSKAVVGFITECTGSVRVTPSDGIAKAYDSAAARFRAVIQGDRIRAVAGTVRIAFTDGRTVNLKEGTPDFVCTGKALPRIADKFVRGGLSRGAGDGRIVEPSQGCRVAVSLFRVEWNPQPNPKEFTLEKIGAREGIQYVADSSEQLLPSPADSAALRAYIVASKPGKFRMYGKAGDEFQRFEFEVVSDTEWKRVSSTWLPARKDRPETLVLRAHQAGDSGYIHEAQRLLREASDAAPKSPDIARLLLEVAKVTGNTALQTVAESRLR